MQNDTTAQITGDELREFIEREEQYANEVAAIRQLSKDNMSEAKARGFDTKIIKKIIALRKKSADDRANEDAILELYKEVLGM